MQQVRTEHDSMGSIDVPADALYGAQTQRAINNFTVSGQKMPENFIRALILLKDVAAQANVKLGELDNDIGEAISQACQSLLTDTQLITHFPIDVFQTGSGTSTNMNANEVIANLASRTSGLTIHPNDHVNYGQSSNDVIPSCIHISAALAIHKKLLPAVDHLINTINEKAKTLEQYCKTGRTHLMDAMPIRMDQSLSGWAAQLLQQVDSLNHMLPALQTLALGGTAVGTGINAPPKLADNFCQLLSQRERLKFNPAKNYFALMASQDTAVSVSGAIKSLAVTMMKIANDLRWMNSGPLAGLAEIALPALQPGSSIMPGKVNPVIPEAVAMAAAQVMGNDVTITVAGQSGNFELNVMLPLVASNLLSSIDLMSNSASLMADKAIKGFNVNAENIKSALHKNPILVTALNPIIGYAKAAEIAKIAYRENKPIIDIAEQHTTISRAELTELLDPVKLTKNHS